MGDPLVNSIFLPGVTIEEINEIITSLKNGAAGWDEFTPQIIKEIRNLISFPLVHICKAPVTLYCDPTALARRFEIFSERRGIAQKY